MAAPHKGSWFGLPDFGVTEKINDLLKRPRTNQGGSNLYGSQIKSSAQTKPKTNSVQGASTTQLTGYNTPIPGKYGVSTGGTYNQAGGSSQGTVVPSTGGEGVSGGGEGDGGGGYDYLGALRDSFSKSRGALESILPTYDTDYANYEKNINSQIDTARQTKEAQDQQDELTYGKSLRSLLKSDNELKQRRQGVFSSLNSLDSSAFRDDVTKADQSLLENQQALEVEKRNYLQERQREFTAYENQAKSQLNAYQTEIQRAKASLQQAIASVNMDEAASIQNYIDKLSSEAQQVQSNLFGLATNLAQLQAQGVNVASNLRGMNMGQFANTFGQNIANKIGQVTSRYTLPQNKMVGSGYINPRTGAAYTDEERRLLGL